MIDATKRAALADLRLKIKALEAPEREAAKRSRKAKSKERSKGLVRTKEQRHPRVRNNGYLAFLRRQPCLACGATPSDAAHVRFAPHGSGWRYVGKGEKPDDARAVPLCRTHHEQQHGMSEAVFWSQILRRDPVETCAELFARFDGSVVPRTEKESR